MDGGRAFFRPGKKANKKSLERAKTLFNYYKKMNYLASCLSMDEISSAGARFFKSLDPKGELFVSVNCLEKGHALFPPFRIFDVKGKKVAVIGITDKSFYKLGNKDIKIIDPESGLKKYLPVIQKNSDIVIVLSSLNLLKSKEILKKFPEIDLMISSGITTPTYVPIRAGNALIVTSHPKGKSVGLITLYFDKKGQIKDYKNKLIMLREEILVGEGF